ncbi:m7GpppX diphosphatase [Echinococcus granulosus]|uniref:m7GpppX diphosphatase n=1 Tax=Echinococcus granulosus TaxID=6210 RepID=A0A068W750_ECHGR|nr:m7GpppX diphosphatase [Echinococcus granulosus]KAH9286685.1 m7GpppX diphosphatase [Echinococcus granulosus]CDS15370.1 scavenger mRNA decapping enzyme DcpS [Echinococcus granulosus]
MSQSGSSSSHTSSTSSPPRKRRRTSINSNSSSTPPASAYSPSNTRIIRVLRNDIRSKVIYLHVRFKDSLDQDAIVILQKSPFPNEIPDLCEAQVGVPYVEGDCDHNEKETNFPTWKVDEIVSNDRYRRFSVVTGLERANRISMTVIHPAEAHHFSKYTSSKRQIVLETPQTYQNVILPFLESNPKDLSWVDNILNGTAEVERVLLTDKDANFGFTLVLDYRWDGSKLHELHALALARNPRLTCLRDLRACHLPMLRTMLTEGRKQLVAKYNGEKEDGLREDQIIAYFHYPPTFYRLHMHFIHVEGPADGGTQVGKATLAEDVIENVEMKSEYYAERTVPIYLHDNHPFLDAIRKSEHL